MIHVLQYVVQNWIYNKRRQSYFKPHCHKEMGSYLSLKYSIISYSIWYVVSRNGPGDRIRVRDRVQFRRLDQIKRFIIRVFLIQVGTGNNEEPLSKETPLKHMFMIPMKAK